MADLNQLLVGKLRIMGVSAEWRFNPRMVIRETDDPLKLGAPQHFRQAVMKKNGSVQVV